MGELEEAVMEGSIKQHFEEIDKIQELIANIPNVVNNQILKEKSDENFLEIVDKYLEQPHLLDPHLDDLINNLLQFIHGIKVADSKVHCAFKYLYFLTKVRGHKIMIRKFPHEVTDLEPILDSLFQQDINDQMTWETRYILLIWLSMICLIPFDMSRFDSCESSSTRNGSVMARILEIGKLYLITSSDNSQEAAAILLSKFITRPDIYRQHLPQFVDWCLEKITTADSEMMKGIITIQGCLSALALMFKQGKRNELLQYCDIILRHLTNHDLMNAKNTVLRKLVVKLTQRIGMTMLKPRLAAWRYQRGHRSLSVTLKKEANLKEEEDFIEQEEEEYDIPEEIETVLEFILNGLKDKDTIVRWSAAKGIGRITSRLPKELADEVVESVLENFTISESDNAWHGGCLTLAELGRRGLLLPDRLFSIVPILLKSLIYDERRGACSVGAHVRDAACYLAWSFARAYEPAALERHVKKIAQSLLITTVFDREVNCRRAASAAFQENVGRQGNFPHGIDILTKADYFAVSSRANTYLKIAPYIAQYPEYTRALVDHLIKIKLDHWDSNIRWLAAESMHKLTKLIPDYVAGSVLSDLIPLCTGLDMICRHGAMIIVAEVVHSLHEIEIQKSCSLISGSSKLKEILRIVAHLKQAKLFRGLSGEMMRISACHLIARLSQCTEAFLVPKLISDGWLDIIHETLSNLHLYNNNEEICKAAISALSSINCVNLIADPFTTFKLEDTSNAKAAIETYIQFLSSDVEKKRCGYAKAIASLPKQALQLCFMTVLSGLIKASSIFNEKELYFADSRADAVKAISQVCVSVGISEENDAQKGLCQSNLDLIYDSLFASLDDYTRDNRGDVGSYVRIESMKALRDITICIANKNNSLLSETTVAKMMARISQQACEKIHKVRDFAIECFVKLLHASSIPHIPHKNELLGFFPTERTVFPMGQLFDNLKNLIALPNYSYNIIFGLIISVGDLTQSLAEASGAALFSYLDSNRNNQLSITKFCQDFISVFRNNTNKLRVVIPLFKTLNQLLVNNSLSILTEASDDVSTNIQDQLLALTKKEIFKSKNTQKVLLSINIFCGLLQFTRPEFRKSVISQILILLCHRYPIVRRTTGVQLYEMVLTYDELISDQEQLEEVMMLLSETEWDQNVTELRAIRNNLCASFGVPCPRIVKNN